MKQFIIEDLIGDTGSASIICRALRLNQYAQDLMKCIIAEFGETQSIPDNFGTTDRPASAGEWITILGEHVEGECFGVYSWHDGVESDSELIEWDGIQKALEAIETGDANLAN